MQAGLYYLFVLSKLLFVYVSFNDPYIYANQLLLFVQGNTHSVLIYSIQTGLVKSRRD